MKNFTLGIVFVFGILAVLAFFVAIYSKTFILLTLTFVFGAVARIAYTDYKDPLL